MVEKIAVAPREGAFDGLCTCGYHTDLWPSAEIAGLRIRQHLNEHNTGDPMPAIEEFRAEHGLVREGRLAKFPDGAVELDEE